METHEWVSVALLSGYTVFLTAVNNINVLSSSCKMLDIIVQF
jgi:hypothetical protein